MCLPCCLCFGTGQAGGILTGKHRFDSPPEGGRFSSKTVWGKRYRWSPSCLVFLILFPNRCTRVRPVRCASWLLKLLASQFDIKNCTGFQFQKPYRICVSVLFLCSTLNLCYETKTRSKRYCLTTIGASLALQVQSGEVVTDIKVLHVVAVVFPEPKRRWILRLRSDIHWPTTIALFWKWCRFVAARASLLQGARGVL